MPLNTDTLTTLLDLLAKIALPLLAIILPLIAQLPGVRATFKALKYFQRDRYKQDSEFAHQLFERDGDPSMKRYAEDLSYAALIGDDELSFEEKNFLISCKTPQHTISRYLAVKSFVNIDILQKSFVWKNILHEKESNRKSLTKKYFALYAVFCLLAFSPYVLWLGYGAPSNQLSHMSTSLLLCSICFLLFSAIFLRQLRRLANAEKLIAKHNASTVSTPPKKTVRQWLMRCHMRLYDGVLAKK